MNLNMKFTNAACDYIKKMIEKEHGVGMRLTIKKTGCSGYSYLPSVLDKENKNDHTILIDNGVKIFIDDKWLHLLDGITVDYVEDEHLGIKQKKLVFINPKESGRCGCGDSFHVS